MSTYLLALRAGEDPMLETFLPDADGPDEEAAPEAALFFEGDASHVSVSASTDSHVAIVNITTAELVSRYCNSVTKSSNVW